MPETQPALGKTLKRVLDPSRVNPSLELPPGWTVERGAVDLSGRLATLGVRAGAASRRSASDARDAQLLRGRMQALRPDEIALREVASLPPPPPPPLDADAREAELLRRRVEAQRARRDLPFDELAAKAAATPAARDAGAAARFLVLDDRGEALTPQLLADVTPLDSAADAPTVVALAADAFAEDEERSWTRSAGAAPRRARASRCSPATSSSSRTRRSTRRREIQFLSLHNSHVVFALCCSGCPSRSVLSSI